eukprot:365408-Chlamydomonas_euryale.AAC.27
MSSQVFPCWQSSSVYDICSHVLHKNCSPQVDDLVFAVDAGLYAEAAGIAARLRKAGRRVDLVLEGKKMKWALKQAERCNAARVVLVGSDEWSRGTVMVKDMAAREQAEVPLDQLK